jgi:hypothetical protein
MSAPVGTQVDAGVALALGAIVVTAAIRKFQRPRVIALTLERLEPALVGRRSLARRIAIVIAAYEAVVGVGIVATRGTIGFVFACAMLVACVGFLAALVRAVQQSVPCACFGRLGRTAAGGREIGRGIVLVSGATFVVVYRATAAPTRYGAGAIALVAFVGMAVLIVAGQRVGTALRPGVELRDADSADARSFARSLRSLAGVDNDLYTTDRG